MYIYIYICKAEAEALLLSEINTGPKLQVLLPELEQMDLSNRGTMTIYRPDPFTSSNGPAR